MTCPGMTAYIAEALAMIAKAAPFIDVDDAAEGWRPSELLRIGFFVLLSGRHPEQSAVYLNDMLAAARDRYRHGLSPNPFGPNARALVR